MLRIRRGLGVGLFVGLAGALVVGCAGAQKAKKELRLAVDEKRPKLDQCYADALQRDASTEGRMQLWVHVDEASGRVTRVEVGEQSPVTDAQLGQCFNAALQGIRLRQPPPAHLKVEYSFVLEPKGATGSGGSAQPSATGTAAEQAPVSSP